MTKFIACVLAFGAVALLGGTAGADDISSPHKTVVAATNSGLDFSTNPTVNVQISKKGAKGQMLIVTGTGKVAPTSTTIGLHVDVNGIALDLGLVKQKCNGGICSVAGTWWMDLDTAETANPGVFYKQLLNISVIGSADVSATGTISTTAHLMRK